MDLTWYKFCFICDELKNETKLGSYGCFHDYGKLFYLISYRCGRKLTYLSGILIMWFATEITCTESNKITAFNVVFINILQAARRNTFMNELHLPNDPFQDPRIGR